MKRSRSLAGLGCGKSVAEGLCQGRGIEAVHGVCGGRGGRVVMGG